MDVDGSYVKYKARLVSKGFSQFHGVDCIETFAQVAKMDSIRLVLTIVASKRWEVHHMDVNQSSFLHGDLHEQIYMQKHKFLIYYLSLVYKLKKSLYGLKQAPRAWYAKMDNFLLSQGFERYKSDPNVYLQHFGDSIMIIVLYVDDILITISFIADIGLVKSSLHIAFSMTDLGLLK